MIFENYQWVIMDTRLSEVIQPVEFVYNGVKYNCSMRNMMTALEKALLTHYELLPSSNSKLVSNTTYANYLYEYEQYRKYL